MTSTATAHRLFAARPRSGVLLDAAIAAAAFGGSLAQMSHGGIPGAAGDGGDLDLLGVVLAACASLPLLAWRRAPAGVFAFTAATAALIAGLGYSLGLPLGPMAALYLLAASRDEGHPWTRVTTGLVVALLVTFLGATAVAQETFPGSELLHTGLAWAAAWFAGERTRLRHEHVADLAERARRVEREAERERQLAVAEERARIARDLHDSAGHAINVIALRAGTARMRRDPVRSQAALEAIEELARETVDEIDQIVDTLRDHGRANGPVEAPPGLASLDALIADHRAAGLEVTVEPTTALPTLRGVVDQASYRILQEALTNAARHGAGTAQIKLAVDDAGLELTVTNPVSNDSQPRAAGGHGLIGMRERATLLGGDLDAGRRNGAFRVRARIPFGGHGA
jgi:signal transduction histidine kinase